MTHVFLFACILIPLNFVCRGYINRYEHIRAAFPLHWNEIHQNIPKHPISRCISCVFFCSKRQCICEIISPGRTVVEENGAIEKSDGFVSARQKVHYVMIPLYAHYYFPHYMRLSNRAKKMIQRNKTIFEINKRM